MLADARHDTLNTGNVFNSLDRYLKSSDSRSVILSQLLLLFRSQSPHVHNEIQIFLTIPSETDMLEIYVRTLQPGISATMTVEGFEIGDVEELQEH